MSFEKVHSAIAEIGDAFHQFVEKRFAPVEAEIARIRDEREMQEALADRPHANAGGARWSKDHHEHVSVFCEWLRRPNDGHTRRRLEDAQHEMQEKSRKLYGGKAVTIGTPSAGGYAVPEILDSQIEQRVNLLNPFRSLVRVVQVGSRDWKALVSANEAGSGWVGEGDARSETNTSRLFERAPTFGTLYAYPKASEESMQDIFFDVQQWLIEEAADGFAAAEASAIVSGDGQKKPTGFLNSVSASDDYASPERAPGAIQFLPVTTSPQALNPDDLITLSMSLKDRYLMDSSAAAWIMRRSTAAVLMLFKDPATGAYLWQRSLAAGQPDTLLGYPVVLTDAMPPAAADQYPIAFGNWRRGYLLADRVGSMQITVDDNITTPGQVRFYLRRVVGGCVYNHEAVKVLKIAD